MKMKKWEEELIAKIEKDSNATLKLGICMGICVGLLISIIIYIKILSLCYKIAAI